MQSRPLQHDWTFLEKRKRILTIGSQWLTNLGALSSSRAAWRTLVLNIERRILVDTSRVLHSFAARWVMPALQHALQPAGPKSWHYASEERSHSRCFLLNKEASFAARTGSWLQFLIHKLFS